MAIALAGKQANFFSSAPPRNLFMLNHARYSGLWRMRKRAQKKAQSAKLSENGQGQQPKRTMRQKWEDNRGWISKAAGIATAAAALAMFDIFIIGGDLLWSGAKSIINGSIEPLGVVVGMPIAIMIEGAVLFVGYRIGRALDPDDAYNHNEYI